MSYTLRKNETKTDTENLKRESETPVPSGQFNSRFGFNDHESHFYQAVEIQSGIGDCSSLARVRLEVGDTVSRDGL